MTVSKAMSNQEISEVLASFLPKFQSLSQGNKLLLFQLNDADDKQTVVAAIIQSSQSNQPFAEEHIFRLFLTLF